MANLFGKAGQPGSYEHCNEAVINYWGAVNLGGEQLLKHGKYMQFLKFSFHKKTDMMNWTYTCIGRHNMINFKCTSNYGSKQICMDFLKLQF
jgi:hypothetical protein